MATAEPNVGVQQPQDGDEPLLLCPACGYDLRATAGDRCSECGLAIDRAALRESGFPWAHRRKIGRVRAYVRTVWQVASHSRKLAGETARPQESRDGRSFRWVTAVLVAATLLGAWGWVVGANDGLAFLAYQPFSGRRGSFLGSQWETDLAVPWSAGATLPWVVPACLVLLAAYVTGVQQAVFRVGVAAPAEYRRRAGAIAHYAAGPLALLLPALGCFAARAAVGREFNAGAAAVALAVVGGLLVIGTCGGTLLRVGQWGRRVRHGGSAVGLLAAVELAGLWLLGAVLMLGVVPWCVGYLWIAVDSFR